MQGSNAISFMGQANFAIIKTCSQRLVDRMFQHSFIPNIISIYKSTISVAIKYKTELNQFQYHTSFNKPGRTQPYPTPPIDPTYYIQFIK